MDAKQGLAPRNLDDLFRRAAARSPDALALIDPPDRQSFTDGPARRLRYAEADLAIEATARQLLDLGLAAGSVVAFQTPNIVESIIVLLGIWRAGLIAAPMPLLWRLANAVAALGKVTPRALVTIRRVVDTDHSEIAMHVAAEIFAVRYVCGFGPNLPDGVIGLDRVFEAATPISSSEQIAVTPQDRALFTFELRSKGVVAVPHTHTELMVAGSEVVRAAALQDRGPILAALATTSFAAIGSIVVPWLITGGTLILHQPFSPEAFASQCIEERCQTAVLPGPILSPLQEAGVPGAGSVLRQVLSIWRSPEFLPAAPAWVHSRPACIDVSAFGELGLIAQRRGEDGAPAGFPIGSLGAPSAIEIRRTQRGTLALRGAMVPKAVLDSRGYSAPPLDPDPDGFIDTEYPCRIDRERNLLIVSGPPAGMVHVGGYRFAWREVQALISDLGEGASIAALPDRLAGHRLAGVAADRERIRSALDARGVNPLIAAAFREHG